MSSFYDASKYAARMDVRDLVMACNLTPTEILFGRYDYTLAEIEAMTDRYEVIAAHVSLEARRHYSGSDISYMQRCLPDDPLLPASRKFQYSGDTGGLIEQFTVRPFSPLPEHRYRQKLIEGS